MNVIGSEQFLEQWEAAALALPLGEDDGVPEKMGEWFSVPVPGHWQLHPKFADYNGLVLYRCRFEPGPHESPDGMFSIRFGGVYYAARIWLNGEFLGSHEGYFAPFEFECTDLLRRGPNELLVEIYSPKEADENDRETLGGVWTKWDAMDHRVNPGGIFRPVVLVRSGGVRIRSLGVEADLSGECRAVARLYSRTRTKVVLKGSVRPLGFEAPGAEFEEEAGPFVGETRVVVPFTLAEPRLWWTRDRGEQPLYELDLRCSGAGERVRFGVRSVELRRWKVYLNGEQVFLRGTNYIPADAYPARATETLLREDARMLCEANLNSVRVHVHVTEKAFYDACDELGLLVLQDFPLQWTHQRRILEPATGQAAEMARLLRSHPSVGVYLIHDEPFYVMPPKEWTVLRLARTTIESVAPRWTLWQRRVLAPATARALAAEDGSRPAIEAAGLPLSAMVTTNHLYFGWYYARFRDLEHVARFFPSILRLPTEYGAQALPAPESLDEIWPENTAPPWRDLGEHHCFQRERMERYVPWRGDRDAYIRETQSYQARVIKHATELFRRRKYRPTAGAFVFMFNDSSPAITWSVVDWRRRPKSGYAAMRKAMSPVLICAKYPGEVYRPGKLLDLPVFAVNDLPRALGQVDWSWSFELDGMKVAGGAGRSAVPSDSVVRLGRVILELPAAGHASLRLNLSGEDVTTSNSYEFHVGTKPPSGNCR